MGYYNNIFASTYKYYSKFKREAPRISSICVLAVSQFTSIILVLAIFKRLGYSSFSFIYPYRYFTVFIFFLWLYLLSKSYSLLKIQDILNEFNSKSLTERRIWAILAFLSFILPTVLIFLVLIR